MLSCFGGESSFIAESNKMNGGSLVWPVRKREIQLQYCEPWLHAIISTRLVYVVLWNGRSVFQCACSCATQYSVAIKCGDKFWRPSSIVVCWGVFFSPFRFFFVVTVISILVTLAPYDANDSNRQHRPSRSLFPAARTVWQIVACCLCIPWMICIIVSGPFHCYRSGRNRQFLLLLLLL